MKSKCFELDIYPEYYQPVREGIKTFEIRRDQGFKVGDIVVLNEFDPIKKEYTGRFVARKITYITDYAQKENYVVFAMI